MAGLTVKASLHRQSWREEPVEIRRFTVDQDVSTSFAYLVEKVAQVFPSVQPGGVDVAWKDGEGDIVSISSDAELIEALDQFDGTVFRLYLKQKDPTTLPSAASHTHASHGRGENKGPHQSDSHYHGEHQQQHQGATPKQSGNILHPGVVCDGCSGPIYGNRYKCLVCHDYDLCSVCEAKGVHTDHNMVTITDPFSYNPWGFQNPWKHGFHGGRGPWNHGRWHGGRCHGFYGGPFRGPCGGVRFGHPGAPHSGFGPWAGFGGGSPGYCFQGAKCDSKGPADNKTCPGTSGEEQMETTTSEGEQQTPQQQQQQNQEDRKQFLHGIGQAVSSFLEPFGVKVDIDVVGEDGQKHSQSTGDAESATASGNDTVPAEFVEQALTQLRSMGYEDEGGWLTELVKAKGGDIPKILDALHPSENTD